MRARKFDTLKYANRLKEVGVDPKTAEAIAEGQAAANEDIITTLLGDEGLATKHDLSQFATKDDLSRFATKDDLSRFATKDDLLQFATKQELAQFATKNELLQVESRLELKIAEVRSDVKQLESTLMLKLSGIVLAALTVLTALTHFMNH